MNYRVIPAKLTGAPCPAQRSHAGGVAGLLNGIQTDFEPVMEAAWIPAFAGMTME